MAYLRINKEVPSQEATRAGTSQIKDTYIERLLKVISSEAIVAFFIGLEVIPRDQPIYKA